MMKSSDVMKKKRIFGKIALKKHAFYDVDVHV